MNDLFEPSDDHGLEQRDYRIEPVGSVFPVSAVQLFSDPIPRERWPDLIKTQKSLGTSPLVAHQYHEVPVLDQGSLKYCWAYSVVAGVMNRLAFQGIDPVPHLSATAVAAVGLNFANRGGHCSKAVKMMQDQGGIPSVEAWPNRSLDRTLKSDPKVLESREMNQLCSFTDCGDNLDMAISLMLSETPCPVTFSVPWWKHAILGLEVLDRGGAPATSLDRYGIAFVNSYGSRWNNNGYGEFWGNRLNAWEYVGVHQALPRAEK